MKPAMILTCALFLSACAGESDTYPRLLPTDQILAEPALPDHAPDAAASPDAANAQAETQAEALRRRADSLRGPVIEEEIRSRMRPQE